MASLVTLLLPARLGDSVSSVCFGRHGRWDFVHEVSVPKGTRAAEGQGGKDQATTRSSANINAAMLLLGKGFLVELDRPAQVGTRQPAHSPSWPRSRPPLDPSPLGVQSPPGWPSVREQTRRRRGASTSTVQVSTRNNSSLDRSQITQGALAHVHTDMPGLTGWLAARMLVVCTTYHGRMAGPWRLFRNDVAKRPT